VQKSGATKFEFLEQLHIFAVSDTHSGCTSVVWDPTLIESSVVLLLQLAHILRRPIIVYADYGIRKDGVCSKSRRGLTLTSSPRDVCLAEKVVYELSDSETMAGVYLPLEWPVESCRKDPLAIRSVAVA
jgi:hypothetical protein